jgi:hypothetical protein
MDTFPVVLHVVQRWNFDIGLTKDPLSLLLHSIHSPFYWSILKKTILVSGFESHFKKILGTRKLDSVHE